MFWCASIPRSAVFRQWQLAPETLAALAGSGRGLPSYTGKSASAFLRQHDLPQVASIPRTLSRGSSRLSKPEPERTKTHKSAAPLHLAAQMGAACRALLALVVVFDFCLEQRGVALSLAQILQQ